MSWNGVRVIPIVLGREGLWGVRNAERVPLGAAKALRNATLEDGTYRSGGGASKVGTAIGTQGNAAIDFWPDAATQRTIAAVGDGSIQKDDGEGASWASLVSGLTTAGAVPFFALGGAEEAGRDRKVFYCDRVNAVRVLSGDGASMTVISKPPADWSGTNQPGFLFGQGGIFGGGYMWGGGNANAPHTAYRSALNNHEDYLSFQYQLPIVPGVGERLVAGLDYKGVALFWKFPEGAFAVDTRDPDPQRWTVIKFSSAGCAGPWNVLLLEDDVLWVAPDGSFHLASATQALGSVRASDISAKKLGSFFRENINLAQLATAQWAYYPHKGVASLACHAQGGTAKNRRIDFNVQGFSPREATVDQIGERWLYGDRDRNEALFMRKETGVLIPAMLDASGQLWELDRTAHTADGAAYTFEWEIWDTDFAALVPAWRGRLLNGRFLQMLYDPRTAGTHTITVLRDGVAKQTMQFALSGGASALPQILTFILAGNVPKLTPAKTLKGQAYRWGFRGQSTGIGDDASLMKLLVGLEAAV